MTDLVFGTRMSAETGQARLLRMPLARCQPRLTVGQADATWPEWTGR